jgi:SAM-dependent methyltransferase
MPWVMTTFTGTDPAADANSLRAPGLLGSNGARSLDSTARIVAAPSPVRACAVELEPHRAAAFAQGSAANGESRPIRGGGTMAPVEHPESIQAVRAYYDALGDKEWERLTATVRDRVSLEVHRRFLRRYVRPGWRVLEVGAGPGRFTFELAALGTRIVVTDISEVQLGLNEARVGATDSERRVEGRELLDVCDTARYADAEFDAVVAFGGPLSYAFERTDEAMRGLLRVTSRKGFVVASVMSWLGAWRHFLPAIITQADTVGEDAEDEVLRTGDLRHLAGDPSVHICQMFRWSDLEALLQRSGGRIVDGSASNWASLGDPEVLARLEADAERWSSFLSHETAACQQPGARDGGTHTLFAAQHHEAANTPPAT